MARITVEDCLKEQNNRFELTLLAAKRARHLVMSGQDPLVPWENDKPTVVALREIAEGLITPEVMKRQEEEKRQAESMDAQDMLARAASSIAQVDAKDFALDINEDAPAAKPEEDEEQSFEAKLAAALSEVEDESGDSNEAESQPEDPKPEE